MRHTGGTLARCAGHQVMGGMGLSARTAARTVLRVLNIPPTHSASKRDGWLPVSATQEGRMTEDQRKVCLEAAWEIEALALLLPQVNLVGR